MILDIDGILVSSDILTEPFCCDLDACKGVCSVALNYHRWNVCRDAIAKGKELNLPIYKFLAEPLTRRFGKQWYDTLCEVAENIDRLKE